jgi:hypothetical protein
MPVAIAAWGTGSCTSEVGSATLMMISYYLNQPSAMTELGFALLVAAILPFPFSPVGFSRYI